MKHKRRIEKLEQAKPTKAAQAFVIISASDYALMESSDTPEQTRRAIESKYAGRKQYIEGMATPNDWDDVK